MYWNLYFICLLLVGQIFIYARYVSRPNLPLQKNKIFKNILITVIATTVINLMLFLATHTSLYHNLVFSRTARVLYFIVYEMCGWYLFQYAMLYLDRYDEFIRNRKYYLLPIQLVIVAIVLSCKFPIIFSISDTGVYSRGAFRWLINLPAFIYTVATTYYISRKGVDTSKPENLAMLFAMGSLLLGLVLNEVLPIDFTIVPFSTVAVTVVFSIMENPYLYKSTYSSAYNHEAFDEVLTEFNYNKTKFYCMGITLTNIESHRAYHSVDELKGVLTCLSDWLSTSFPGSYIFFLNTESFVVVSLDEIDSSEFSNTVQTRITQPFVVDGIRYIFQASTFVVDTPHMFSRSSDMVCAINLIERHLIKRNTDGVYYITRDALDVVNREKLIQEAVERGVDNDSFDVYFQPLVNSSTNKVEGAEALCRLNDTKLGFVSPAEFIPYSRN